MLDTPINRKHPAFNLSPAQKARAAAASGGVDKDLWTHLGNGEWKSGDGRIYVDPYHNYPGFDKHPVGKQVRHLAFKGESPDRIARVLQSRTDAKAAYDCETGQIERFKINGEPAWHIGIDPGSDDFTITAHKIWEVAPQDKSVMMGNYTGDFSPIERRFYENTIKYQGQLYADFLNGIRYASSTGQQRGKSISGMAILMQAAESEYRRVCQALLENYRLQNPVSKLWIDEAGQPGFRAVPRGDVIRELKDAITPPPETPWGSTTRAAV